MPFAIEGETKLLRGALTVVSADNPAATLIGGYKQLHSALRKCRDCLACDGDMKTKVWSTYVVILCALVSIFGARY